MDLADLNPEQKAAVEHGDGPLLVVAGAGTGKTQVITRRIAKLIDDGKAQPSEVLALTFTEKAAREMADRLYDLIGWRAFQVPVMTFHAFGTNLLLQYAPHIGRSIQGGLLNDTQKALLLLQHFDDVKLSYYGSQASLFEFMEGVVAYINELQNAAVTLDAYEHYVASLKPGTGGMHPLEIAEQKDLLALYGLYETAKSQTGTYDYHDLLALPLMVARTRPNVAERIAKQYRYVLVDEYQDTNRVQDELLRSFIPPDGNIFAVGDDDQAIYGFRGADINNILSFADHFRLKQPSVLVENYRSGQPILDAAYRLIRHNDPDRLEAKLRLNKQLHAQTQAASALFRAYVSQADEQQAVLDDILARLERGEKPDSIAVLATSRAPLKALARSLRQSQVPFAISAEADIFEQAEMKQLWYLLEWLGGRAGAEAIGHVILGPFVGWSASAYRNVLSQARQDAGEVEDSLRILAERDDQAAALVRQLDGWREWARTEPVSRLAYRLVFETGLSDRLIRAAEKSSRAIRVFEDLGRLLNQMQDYEVIALDPTLAGYLAVFPKPPQIEVNEAVGEDEGVQLLTVHGSKGLEFDTVYLINCTQPAWSPNAGGRRYTVPAELKTEPELPPEHEFRRLMYVAVTRAKKSFTASAATRDNGGRRITTARFISELFGDTENVGDTTSLNQESGVKQALHKLQRFYPLKSHYDADRLPFETSDGWIELGVNDLGSYDRCPYDFYLDKVLGIHQPFGPQLAFGTALHGAFEYYYRSVLAGQPATRTQVTDRLEELWSDRGYERRELADQAHATAKAALARFLHREPAAADRKLKDTEMKFILEIPEAKLRLRGKIDAMFDVEGGIEVRDFKTGNGKRDAEKLSKEAKENFQLRTYALAVEQMTGTAPARVVLDYVVTDTIGTAQLSPAILTNHRQKLAKLADAIRNREFLPKPSQFHQCAAIRYYGSMEEDIEDYAVEG